MPYQKVLVYRFLLGRMVPCEKPKQLDGDTYWRAGWVYQFDCVSLMRDGKLVFGMTQIEQDL
jgi:hypothetical protein